MLLTQETLKTSLAIGLHVGTLKLLQDNLEQVRLITETNTSRMLTRKAINLLRENMTNIQLQEERLVKLLLEMKTVLLTKTEIKI